MAYATITAGQVDANSPIDDTLMDQIRLNFDAHETEKLERDGTIPMTGDLSLGSNDITNVGDVGAGTVTLSAGSGAGIDTNGKDVDTGGGDLNLAGGAVTGGTTTPGRAYFAGQLGTDDAWVTLSGADATAIDWRGKRVIVKGDLDVSVDITAWSDGQDISGVGELTSGTSRDIDISGVNTLNLRSNSSTGYLEVQRPTGSRSATTYYNFAVVVVNA